MSTQLLADGSPQDLGNVIQKAWADPVFKERLKANPAAVLNEMNIRTPQGVQIEVVENTSTKIYLNLPAPPFLAEVTDADLNRLGTVHAAATPLTPGCGPTNGCC